jgi:hypothetical protein
MDWMHLSPSELLGQAWQLVQIGDPSAALTWANILGLIGGIFYITSIWMKTVIPLRVAGIASAFFFFCAAVVSRSLPSVFLYGVLVPLNILRLYQITELIKKIRLASGRDISVDWLEPFMTRRKYRKGDRLFEKGDLADEMFLNVSGRFLVRDIEVEIGQGRLFGEMGILTPGSRRLYAIDCIESGAVLTVSYDKLRELYFENPEFGFHFLRLTSERMLQNIARLEKRVEELAARDAAKISAEVPSPQNPG